jgi:hypothetical protein
MLFILIVDCVPSDQQANKMKVAPDPTPQIPKHSLIKVVHLQVVRASISCKWVGIRLALEPADDRPSRTLGFLLLALVFVSFDTAIFLSQSREGTLQSDSSATSCKN